MQSELPQKYIVILIFGDYWQLSWGIAGLRGVDAATTLIKPWLSRIMLFASTIAVGALAVTFCVCSLIDAWLLLFDTAASYTNLTLPTNREV